MVCCLLASSFSAFRFHCTLNTACAQINTDRVMMMGRNALYYEDYVLSIQRFNMVINAKPYLSEPYFFRGLAKFYLEDFTGAEQDCTESLERNPYVSNAYQLRGLCRVHQKNYAGAIADYGKVIDMEPKNKPSWHNLILCHFELKQYDEATVALDQMLRYWPRETEVFTMKAQVSMAQEDTVQALTLIDSALAIDSFDAQALVMRASIDLQKGQYAQAESGLDRAILSRPRVAPYYINRALARFHQNDLRGAMADYDRALEIDSRNYLGHFNRGLLRAQVGDDNRAIEDFDYVLSVEPDNMIALFNRALMLDQTGDYRGAIRDISAVIDAYPEFWTGYQQRAAIRRKIGDTYGAERDEFRILKARMDARAGIKSKTPAKTRKQSERNIEDYASIVEADSDEPVREYASAYRGRVQDRQVELQSRPLYVLSCHQGENPTSRYVPFHRSLQRLVQDGVQDVCLTCVEIPLQPNEMQRHFDSASARTKQLEELSRQKATDQTAQQMAHQLLLRSLDYYHVRDFDAAISDLEHAAELQPSEALIPFMAAQVRCRQLEAQTPSDDALSVTAKLGYARALDELRRTVQLEPDFAYAWYNIGVIHSTMHDYTEACNAYTRALNLDPRFPDAYYNRGVARLLAGQRQLGLSDLSQAGEYGLYQAYNLIKRYSKESYAGK